MPTPSRYLETERTRYRITTTERHDARRALQLLAGSGLSLVQAAEIALAGKRSLERVSVAVAVDRFLLSRARKKTRRGTTLRGATLEWYESFLAPLVRDFGDQSIDDLTRGRFAKWVRALNVGETSRVSIIRSARALWRWALAEDPPLVAGDVTLGLDAFAPRGPESERMVLTPAQAAAILADAGPGRSAVALMLFAGIRPEEIAGRDKPWLRWEHINLPARFIRIPAEISKTGKARLLENLPPTLWLWLAHDIPGHRHVSPVTARILRERAMRAARIATWPHDCFRHTAATYLVTYRRDAGIVAEWLGHEGRPTLLHQVYRGQLTLDRTQIDYATAAAYHALRPPELAAPGAALLALLAARARSLASLTR